MRLKLLKVILLLSVAWSGIGVIRSSIWEGSFEIMVLDGCVLLSSLVLWFGLKRGWHIDGIINWYGVLCLLGFIAYWKYLSGFDGPMTYIYFSFVIIFSGLMKASPRLLFVGLLTVVCIVLTLDRNSQALMVIRPGVFTYPVYIDYLFNVCIVLAGIYFIKSNFDRDRKEQQKNSEKLQAINDELDVKHELLLHQQRQIEEIHSNLENMVSDSTTELVIKHQRLSTHAYDNAHIVRGPLSNIMALAGMLDHEQLINQKMLNDIKNGADDLDRVIQKINDVLQSEY